MADIQETPGFVPASEWPTLVDLCTGFDEHLMPASQELSGQRLVLITEEGFYIEHHFIDVDNLRWHIVQGNEHVGLNDQASYQAFQVRPGVFFVDFYKEAYSEQVSLVLDLNSGKTVIAISGFHDTQEGRRTTTTFSNAYIQGQKPSEPFAPTDELLGKHMMYQYTSNDVYEHIYLNRGTLSWHCLSGTEKGLADTEPCKMLKLGEKLYLLFWTEKVMPVESVVVVDLKQMRSTGRFFCWDPKINKLVQTRFGSYATMLSDTPVARPKL